MLDFETGPLTGTWGFTDWLWLSSFLHLEAGVTDACSFVWVLGIELRTSCICSKCFLH